MPDWSYHTLFKPVLTRLPDSNGREFIHRGMNLISSILGGSWIVKNLGHTEPSPKLKKNVLGISISNPVGLSGKIDPLLTGTKAFKHLGLGFIEVGPVTTDANKSNAPQFTRDKDNIVFAHTLESLGIEGTVDKLKKIQGFNKPIFIRIGATGSIRETIALLDRLVNYGDAFILEERLNKDDFISLKKVLKSKPLLYSFSHDKLEIEYISSLVGLEYIDGIIIEEKAVDTGRGKLFPLNQSEDLSKTIQAIKESLNIPIIVSGGIKEPKDGLHLFESGADLVLLSSGYVLSGPGLPKRINEALIDIKSAARSEYSGWIWYWIFGFIMLLAGLITLVVSMTVVILPYDESFLRMTREQIMNVNPNILYFMQHDRMTVAGTMISGGFLYMQLARHGVRNGLQWARKAIHIAGIFGFLGILLFLGFGYFDWLHGLLWLLLLPFFLIGSRVTRNFNEHPSSKNRTNHVAWKKSLWGQLSFVSLGISFILAGIFISIVGMTEVFIPTDLMYICMNPEQLKELNDRLIPVIAHDRAGFGSALISVGLLVLMLALWGFQQGEKWVWYTFLIGGIPAFSAGIITHFVIGYTTFIHLLPAYLGVLLFVVGLVLTRDFFFKENEPY